VCPGEIEELVKKVGQINKEERSKTLAKKWEYEEEEERSVG